MSEELQATIDALNARTAAYDVQIADLQQQISQLRSDIVAEKEASATALQDAEDRHAADLAAAKHEAAAELRTLSEKSQVAIAGYAQMSKSLEERWQAQNTYVIALENQSAGEVREALNDFRAAEIRAQIAVLNAKLAAGG